MVGNVRRVVNAESDGDGEEDGEVLVQEQTPELQETSRVNDGEGDGEEDHQGGGQLHHQEEGADEDDQQGQADVPHQFLGDDVYHDPHGVRLTGRKDVAREGNCLDLVKSVLHAVDRLCSCLKWDVVELHGRKKNSSTRAFISRPWELKVILEGDPIRIGKKSDDIFSKKILRVIPVFRQDALPKLCLPPLVDIGKEGVVPRVQVADHGGRLKLADQLPDLLEVRGVVEVGHVQPGQEIEKDESKEQTLNRRRPSGNVLRMRR